MLFGQKLFLKWCLTRKDQLLKDGFVVNTILREADLFCPNSVGLILQSTKN